MAKIRRCPADAAFSNAIRYAQHHTCEHCGRTDGKMEAAHIHSRSHKSIRFDVLNILCLCFSCHLRFTGNPVDFTRWLEGYLGSGHLELLQEKRNRIQKDTKAYRQEVARHYREQLRIMERDPSHVLVSYQ